MDDNTLKRMKGIIMDEMLRNDPELLDKLIGFVATTLTDESLKPLVTTERKLAVLDAMDIKVLEYTENRVVVKIIIMTVTFDKNDDDNVNMSVSFDLGALV
jgi:hypothetical protein